jgi:4-amino-4-deoxy-L-arabinose transferase-like glycosyltransferase
MTTSRTLGLGNRLPLLGLILLATFLRLHSLDDLPPALDRDEAFNGLDALRLPQSDGPRIFFPANNGREPLHIYLQATSLALFGSRPWSLRLASALAGIITVPLLYVFVREVMDRSRRSWQIAVLAAAIITVSYWHLNFSRIAFRAIYMVPLLILTFWLFWHGWRQKQFRFSVLAGVTFGLSLYTYLPVRLIPLIIAGFVLFELAMIALAKIMTVSDWLFLVKGSVITLIVGFLVFAPLGLYFGRHPDVFLGRSEEVSITTLSRKEDVPLPTLLLTNLASTGRMFIDQGHNNPVLNMPGRPALNILAITGLLIGTAVTLFQLKRPGYALLLIWLLVMLIPTIASDEPAHPMRAIGALPVVVTLVAVGLEQIPEWLSGRGLINMSWGWPALLLNVVIVGGVSTYRAYFVRWGNLPETSASFNAPEYYIGERILKVDQSENLLVPIDIFEHPTTRFVLESAARDIDVSESGFASRPAKLIFPRRRCRLQETMILWQQQPDGGLSQHQLHSYELDVPALLTTEKASSTLLDSSGASVVRMVPDLPDIKAAAAGSLPQIVGARFEDICLIAFDVKPVTLAPGGEVELTYYWEDLDAGAFREFEMVVHLVNTAGEALEPFHRQGFDAVETDSDIFATKYTFNLPGDVPPGKYGLHIDLLNNIGEHVGGQTVNGIMVSNYQPDLEMINYPLEVIGGDPPLIKLLGYDVVPESDTTSDRLKLNFYWQASQPIDKNYTVFVHLKDEDGALVAQSDSEPMEGRAPTSW